MNDRNTDSQILNLSGITMHYIYNLLNAYNVCQAHTHQINVHTSSLWN